MSTIRQASNVCLIVLAFVMAFVVSGCGTEQEDTEKIDNPDAWEEDPGELSDHLSNRKKDTAESPDISEEQLLDQTSHARPSGKWFVHNGEGELDYELSSGEMNPGQDWNAQLIADENSRVELDQDVRIQLKEIAEDFSEKGSILDETIHITAICGEETIMEGRLPSGRGKTYVLSVEIIGTNGLVADTLVSQINVPAEKVDVTISVDKRQYKASEDQTRLTLVNQGPSRLTFGKEYRIEKHVSNTWRVVPLDLEFEEIGVVVDIHGQHEQKISLKGLNTGRYRVVKRIWSEGLKENVRLAAEFSINS